MRPSLAACSLLLAAPLLAAPLLAQPPAAVASPPGWRWALDQPARLLNGGRFTPTDSTWDFVHMAPGWHVTMGPGGHLFDPSNTAGGRFAVEAEMILFPNSSNEEFGIFVGGAQIGEPTASWTAFTIRRDGNFAVRAQRAGTRATLVDWTQHEAVKALTADGTVKNYVRVLAEPDSVRLFVNSARVGAWPRAAVVTDGIYGFRIGKGTNLHITNLDHTRRHAPFPAPKP